MTDQVGNKDSDSRLKTTLSQNTIIMACTWGLLKNEIGGGGALEWQEGVSGSSMDSQKTP